MIGRKVLPCGHHRVRLPELSGEYHRTCDVCKRTYIADVTPSEYWTQKMKRPELVVHWDVLDLLSPDEPDTRQAGTGVDDDGGQE